MRPSSIQRGSSPAPARAACRRALPVAAACLATLLSAPAVVSADDFVIPDVPLQSGTAAPAPNVMFILDDSGSMEFDSMPAPDDVPDIDEFNGDEDDDYEDDFDYDESYIHNTIYYDPSVDYEPWVKADGTRYTDGTTLESVWGHASLRSSAVDISSTVRTFFVPKSTTSDLSDIGQYYRYQIRTVSNDGVAGPRVVRSEYANNDSDEVELLELDNVDISKGSQRSYTVTVPSGASVLEVETDNGNGDADLYVWMPDTSGTLLCESESNDNSERCVIDDPAAGQYTIVVFASDRVRNVDIDATYTVTSGLTEGVDGAGCADDDDSGPEWRGCTFTTPTGRSEADEESNFATWYSYHRTRMKVAKAGASEAFNQLGDNYRVGYDSIWNRRGADPVAGNDPAYPIPVATNGGLFTRGGTNRTTWFDYLHRANGNDGTPLHGALQRAGAYFESADPWDSGDGSDISCRQSFAILTTDGYWNSGSGYTSVGDVDTTAGPTIARPDGASGADFTYTPVNPYQDPDGNKRYNTLADVAMYYWKRDLRATLENNVPVSANDPAFWQHMVTFGVSIGLQGSLDPDVDLPAIADGSKDWPNPMDTEDEDRIDDLWHASVNGRGQFVAATNPDQFVNGLIDALSTVSERLGSASNVTANSTSFRTDTRVYQASYVSGRWSGDLKAYVATTAGVAAEPEWEASQGIPDVRNILTYDGSENSAGSDGAEFPTSSQVAALDESARSHAPATGAEVADYIAGDRSLEAANGGDLRNRTTTVLGDIANSSPIYVEDSNTLFVGANDGMLHAFDATDGTEVFAYVPGGIDFDALASLSDPRYGNTVVHKYFVDGPIAVSAKSQTPGKNYLVGSLGRGGRGVFGLDVTDPDDFGTDDVLWEYTSDADIGMVTGDPLIVKLNDADGTMAVVVSNGINSTNGSAVLFVLDLATGELIRKIDTGAVGANGLSAPRGADTDGDGKVDAVYAGDMLGNLWKFDLTGADAGDWGVANSGAPMMVARDDDGVRQPITAGLALARHPTSGDIWVFMGTGSFITAGDLTDDDIQTVYGLIDDGTAIDGRTSAADPGDLIEREILVVTTSSAGLPIRAFEPPQDSLESGRRGWFIDLDDPTPGERIVSGLRVLGSTLIASSIIPPTGNTCDAGGSGFINAIDAFTGVSTGQPFFDINGDGVVDDDDKIATTINGETVYLPGGSIDLGIGMPTRPTVIDKLLVVGGSTGEIGSVTINPQGIGARRISWREIIGG